MDGWMFGGGMAGNRCVKGWMNFESCDRPGSINRFFLKGLL